MSDMPAITAVQDVAIPQQAVSLVHLRTRAGQPVVVMCEAVTETRAAQLLNALPGGRIPTADSGQEPDALALMEQMNLVGRALIEEAAFLSDGSGGEVRPAFWWDASRPRHPASIPGRLLRQEDILAMLSTIFSLCGYLGGAASDTFRRDGGTGAPDGVGIVAPGENHGDQPQPIDGLEAAVS